MKKYFEEMGTCPYCKEITFIADWDCEPECCNCGASIRDKDLLNPSTVEVDGEDYLI